MYTLFIYSWKVCFYFLDWSLFFDQVVLVFSYVPNPVLVIIDVQPKELGIPTKAYYDVEEVKEVGRYQVCFAVAASY